MFEERVQRSLIEESNSKLLVAHQEDFAALEKQLSRRGIKMKTVLRAASQFSVALPSAPAAQGGTRFGRFPALHEPQTVEEKMMAAALGNGLTGVAPRISLSVSRDTPRTPYQ